MITPLTSYSGASFVVEGGQLIKHGRSILGSGEMQIQHTSKWYQTPKVLYVDNEQISMSYLKGARNAAEYLSAKPVKVVLNEITRLVSYILANITGRTTFSGVQIIEKINHILTRLVHADDFILARAIQNKLKVNYTLPSGVYHGDLTLTNILYTVNNEKPYLIDFLPGYISSPILDIVKLKQEYKLGWSKLCDDSLLDAPYNYIKQQLSSFIEPLELFGDTSIFEAINYLRILPYTKTEAMSSLLRKEISLLL